MSKKLPAAFTARSQAVKAAHANLSKTWPGFTKLPAQLQIRHAQRQASQRLHRTGK